MFRSIASRSGAAGVRTLSTGSAPNAPASSATPSKPATPAPPPPPPSGGPGIVRRATPILLTAGTGFFLYKVATDNEFRASVVKTFPASASLLDRIPSADPSKSAVATDASTPVDGEKGAAANLPPGYDTVPDLLRKIEESKTTLTSAETAAKPHTSAAPEKPPVKAVSAEDSLLDMTPTQRAAAKAAHAAPPQAGDGPIHVPRKVEKAPGPKVEKAAAAIAPPVKTAGEAKSALAQVMAADDSDSGRAEESDTKASDDAPSTTGKEKLARLLGKGDFQTDKVDGPDVVDDSVYKKPKPWTSADSPGRGPSRPRRGWKRGSAWKPDSEAIAESKTADGEDPEVLALRSELESQIKWEAFRLQEAVRAQIVEDRKTAAKEAAAMAQKHSEELARVREDAVTQAEKMLKDRTLEMKTRTEAERDADVLRLMKVKEEELREAIAVEYADKERTGTMEREKALLEAKAQVVALGEQFNAVVMQTEKAKEAARRASSAFMLRDTVSSSRPIGKQLAEAGGKTELGQLVVQSVPKSAVRRGVETLDELKEGFHFASKRGLSVAMVPEGNTGTIWGHLLGAIFSRLKIPIDSRDDEATIMPRNNEERIRRAERLVDEGDLGGAIVTLEALSGLSADVMADWLGSAKARVAADLAAEVLLADAIIAQVALTGSEEGSEKRIVG